MPAFYFFDVREIRDPQRLGEYRAGVFASVEAHRGRYRILGGTTERAEGTWSPVLPVLIEFPDLSTARAWYSSDSYRPLLSLRQQAAECDAVLIDGFDHVPGA